MTAPRVGKLIDVERLGVAWLKAQNVASQVGTRLPADISGDVLWVAYAGGSAGYDNSLLRLEVQSFRPGREGAAWPLAQDVHEAMRALEGQTVDGQPVTTVAVWSVPERRFWTDAVDRVVATYELDLPVLV